MLCVRSGNKSVNAAPTYRSRGQQLLATAVHIQEQQKGRDAIQRTEQWVNQVSTEHTNRASRTRRPPERYKNDFVYSHSRGNLVKKKTTEIIANMTKAPDLETKSLCNNLYVENVAIVSDSLHESAAQTICSVSYYIWPDRQFKCIRQNSRRLQ